MTGSSEEAGLEVLPELGECRHVPEMVIPGLGCEVGKGLHVLALQMCGMVARERSSDQRCLCGAWKERRLFRYAGPMLWRALYV